jgi:hypothetical protein
VGKLDSGDVWFLAFQGLLIYQKVNHIINWDWVWVLAPSLWGIGWLTLAIVVAAFSK